MTTTQRDLNALEHLADRLNHRATVGRWGYCRNATAKRLTRAQIVRLKWRRDWRHIAARWLRRYVGGDWYTGGHHVGRLNYGPALAEVKPTDRPPLHVIRGEATP